jgi:hypothetical protein
LEATSVRYCMKVCKKGSYNQVVIQNLMQNAQCITLV